MYYKIKKGRVSIGVNNAEKTEKFLAKRGINYSSKIEGFKYTFYNNLTVGKKPLNEKEIVILIKILEVEGL